MNSELIGESGGQPLAFRNGLWVPLESPAEDRTQPNSQYVKCKDGETFGAGIEWVEGRGWVEYEFTLDAKNQRWVKKEMQ